jgi:hypothetical protein
MLVYLFTANTRTVLTQIYLFRASLQNEARLICNKPLNSGVNSDGYRYSCSVDMILESIICTHCFSKFLSEIMRQSY